MPYELWSVLCVYKWRGTAICIRMIAARNYTQKLRTYNFIYNYCYYVFRLFHSIADRKQSERVQI